MSTDQFDSLDAEEARRLLRRAIGLICDEWGYTRERAIGWISNEEEMAELDAEMAGPDKEQEKEQERNAGLKSFVKRV